MLSSEAGKLGCGCAPWGSTVATEVEEDDGLGLSCPVGVPLPREKMWREAGILLPTVTLSVKQHISVNVPIFGK